MVAAVLLPMLVTPVSLLAMRLSAERLARGRSVSPYQYALASPASAELSEVLQADPRLHELRPADPEAALRHGQVNFVAELLPGPPEPASRRVRIQYPGDREISRDAASRAMEVLREAGLKRGEQSLRERGIVADTRASFAVLTLDVATPASLGGASAGRLLTALVVFLMLTGASGAAMETVAGERERGTLETLLTTAALRSEIVVAKQATILLVALVAALLQLGSLLIWTWLGLIRLPAGFTIPISTATLCALLLLFVPLAALVATGLFLLSGSVSSYREAQVFLLPVFLGSLVPSLAGFLPGLALRSVAVIVPVVNVSVATREVLAGRFDWPFLGLTALVTALAALATLHLGTRVLSDEASLIAGSHPVGPTRSAFEERVVAWFAAMWALTFLGAGFITSVPGQLLYNELVVFLGLPLVMAWRYRLPLRELFALRPVKPAVVLAALLAIAPGIVVGQGVFRLASLLLPVSTGLLEELSRALLPRDLSRSSLVLLMAVLPAVCEELAFRGALLYGLRRRFRPPLLAIAVGATFAFFHFAYFRLVPTAFLGVMLTAFALLTGSVLPGMLVHAGNNALALWLADEGFPLDRLDPWLYAASAVVLALCFWIVYRCRTPYPGLRRSGRSSRA
jgi:sodium transport system permease protein